MQLRDYQQEIIDKVRKEFARGKKRVCLQLPTGAGKTILSAFMIKGALAKGLRVLFLVHLKELIEQTSEKLKLLEIDHGLIAAGEKPKKADCQLAMMQTYVRRMHGLPEPDLIIVDECHRVMGNTYQKIIETYPNAKVLGLTATPQRLDGKGLGRTFESLVCGITTRELMDKGFLNDYEYYSAPNQIDFDAVKTKMGDYDQAQIETLLDNADMYGDILVNYKKYLDGQKAIVFETGVRRSMQTALRLRANGVPAAHLDGGMRKRDRVKILDQFRKGELKVLCNCNLFSEGFDVEDCDGVILARPTKSLSMFLQQIGRGLRKSARPTIIIDHVKNWSRHGLPDDKREWSLDDRKKSSTEQEIKTKMCSVCFCIYPSRCKECPQCGTPSKNIELEEVKKERFVDIELKKIDKMDLQKNFYGRVPKEKLSAAVDACKSLKELQALGKKLKYKPGWAWMKWNEKQAQRS
jgi:superfamily II DNA or RNA helicase